MARSERFYEDTVLYIFILCYHLVQYKYSFLSSQSSSKNNFKWAIIFSKQNFCNVSYGLNEISYLGKVLLLRKHLFTSNSWKNLILRKQKLMRLGRKGIE